MLAHGARKGPKDRRSQPSRRLWRGACSTPVGQSATCNSWSLVLRYEVTVRETEYRPNAGRGCLTIFGKETRSEPFGSVRWNRRLPKGGRFLIPLRSPQSATHSAVRILEGRGYGPSRKGSTLRNSRGATFCASHRAPDCQNPWDMWLRDFPKFLGYVHFSEPVGGCSSIHSLSAAWLRANSRFTVRTEHPNRRACSR